MRARLLVDYNEKLRKGDEVPADLVKKLVRVGLAEEILSAPVVTDENAEPVEAPVAPKRVTKAKARK